MKGSSDLKDRILFTLFILFIYRVGTFIPLPGINAEVMQKFFTEGFGSMFSMVNMFSGGALQRMSIFALNIMPYITASIIIQLMGSVYKGLAELKKEGEYGRRKMNQYTKYLTIVLAFVQAVGIYYALSNMETSAFMSDSKLFLWTTVAGLVGGTMLLMWMGERITAAGIGNGISLIIFVGIVAGIPSMFLKVLELSRQGIYSWFAVLVTTTFFIGFVALIVFIEKTFRKIKIQYPNKAMMRTQGMQDSSFIPLKVNMAGVIPPIFASSILMFPTVLTQFMGGDAAQGLVAALRRGGSLYFVLFAATIIFFAYFYTSITFNTEEVADNLKKSNCFILGTRPGKSTAQYLDKVVFRLTTIGAIYLTFICLVPEILMTKYAVPLAVGGTGILIIVNVIIDMIGQIQSRMFGDKYAGLKNRRIKVRR